MGLNAAAVELDPPSMPPGASRLRGEVREFLDSELSAGSFVPQSDSWLSGHSPEFSRKLGRRGWVGMTWPAAYGGHERSAIERYIVIEELLAAGAPVAAHWMSDRQIGPSLLKHGSEGQKARFLPAMAAGELYFALGMSEPDSGSDLASVRTTARLDGDEWHLEGSKVWTSWAHRSHYALVLCRTGDPGPSRHEGLSQLIVDMAAPGVTHRPIIQLNGEHHFNEVFFDGVRVPADMLLGVQGAGWAQVTAELAYERSGPERFLSTFPLVRRLAASMGDAPEPAEAAALGRAVARLWSVRQLSIGVAGALQEGKVPAVEAAMVKDLGTRLEQDLVELVRLNVPQLDPELDEALGHALAHSPGFTLRGGTTEILRGIVAGGLGL